MSRFGGRNVVVTGASRGIGASVAQRLAAEGASLVIVARTLEPDDRLAGSLSETVRRCERYGAAVRSLVADLSDPAGREGLVSDALDLFDGHVDVLVNNAAAALYDEPHSIPIRRVRLMFEVNVAPLELMQAMTPSMIDRGEGWIVNVSSSSARYEQGRRRPVDVPTPDELRTQVGAYGASKAALNRLTVSYAASLADTGVRVNTVEPRATVMSEGSVELIGDDMDPRWHVESMEAMVEGLTALCDCDVTTTGGVYDSIGLIENRGLVVRQLDGRAPYPGGIHPLETPHDRR